MQAFVAGVEYADRELRTPEAEAPCGAKAEQLKARAGGDRPAARPLRAAGEVRRRTSAGERPPEHRPLCAGEGEARALHHPRDEQPGAVHRRTGGLQHGRRATSRSPAQAPRSRRPATRSSPTATSCGSSTTATTATRAVGCRTRRARAGSMLEFARGAHDRPRRLGPRSRGEIHRPSRHRLPSSKSPMPPATWRAVADSTDRRKFDPQGQASPPPSPPRDSARTRRRKRRACCRRRTRSRRRSPRRRTAQMAFAGTFRTPDDIHLLNRGDPEQPKDEVAPAVLSALGDVEAAEGHRRAGAPPRARRLDRQPAESAHRARDGEPHLAGALRHRPGRDAERLRPQRHEALASRIARLARAGVHPLRLVGQAHAPAHRAVGDLSAVHPHRRCRRSRQGRRRPPALAFPVAPARGRDDSRFDARRERPAQSEDGWPRLRSVRQARRPERLQARRVLHAATACAA